uniref:ATP-binding cassette, subfamily D (ALD), peroxisomal long-chain fatty acid import protein n=1 Tax=Kwoniella dejecticola CBS 10117 TaxID=1296121 RepID=A0A1A6AFT6_9TREE|nr:ATP-binding cassette, subfamily D (ALD), peroxisomal long-chain fatty acid import protein [Kwoniella dejecticola CBS 10117]OBR88921.1 ATP-binding cassette, subfamily D (ALD), peroxisomal long-chain fatty acid import protein [Kwoniella dejecticola CBS 10117]
MTVAFPSGLPSAHRSPLSNLTLRRRQALIVVLISAILARSVPLNSSSLFRRWKEDRAYKKLERKRRETETPLNTPALEKKLVDLYILDPSGSRTLLVPHQGRVSKVRITPTSNETYASHLASFPPLDPREKLGVNKKFWKMLFAVLKVAFPSKTGKEAFLLVLHTFFLLSRTILSVMVARLDGRIVRDLVSANGAGFVRGLGWWFALAIPSTYTNSMIRYLERKLALAFRTNLTRYIHDLYLNDNLNYYKFGLADTRFRFITTDVARFCDSLAALYGNIGKPALDMLIFTSQLAASLGPVGTFGLFTNYAFTAWVLKKATPAFGRMAATEARLEGEYRAGLGRIGRDGEEVAFYNGGKREKGILMSAYEKLAKHVHTTFKARIPYGMTEDFTIKYFWSACGYCLMSLPILFPAVDKAVHSGRPREIHHEVAERTEGYVSNRRLLLSLADAGGRLMYSGKDLAELSGYTSRVYALLSSLHSLNNNIYPENPRPASLKEDEPFYDLSNVHGRVILGPKHLLLRGVPIVAPAGGAAGAERGGEELIHRLDLRVEQGEHTLITGPNGVGKTSIARIVAQLWPTWSGLMERPIHGEGGIFFLPQRPYLSIGSLRDHPHTYAEMKSRGRTDAELMSILEHVHLAYLPSREGGWETRKEWKDVLSGGEKQRMGMARLFYHRPTYAILDECTSAVSSDVEGLMYEHAKNLGITLVTISHRPSLLKYHNRHLRLGDPTSHTYPPTPSRTPVGSTTNLSGLTPQTPSTPLAAHGWQLTTLHSTSAEEKLELNHEIEEIERQLNEVKQWEARLEVIGRELRGEAGVKA